MAEDTSNIVAEVRKLRKKLRQIETLERLDRPLNQEEILKVSKKRSLRVLIREKLKELQADVNTPEKSASAPEHSTAHSEPSASHRPTVTAESDREESRTGAEEAGVTMKRSHDGDAAVVKRQEGGRFKESTGEELTTKRPREERHPPNQQAESTSASPVTGPTAPQRPPPKGKSDLTKQRERWVTYRFSVRDVEGHNDLISSVHCKDGIILSGSRDTTVKAWDLSTGAEICNLGGHSGAVTSVYLLSREESKSLASHFDLDEISCRIALSSSMDCSVRVWDLGLHKEILSIYTYNPVTAMDFLCANSCVVTGSDGGKVEMWNIQSGANEFSSLAHEGSVTCIKVKGEKVVTASEDGVIKLWELRDQSLHVMFESENVHNQSGEGALVQRPITSLGIAGDCVYYGDDGTNVKVLDWRNATVTKLRNHLGEFGSTDAMLLTDDVFLFSSYDLDNGVGSINFFSSDNQYVGTLSDPDLSRIETISCPNTANSHKCFITGGQELRIWRLVAGQRYAGDAVHVTFDPTFTLPTEDSEDDSSESELSSDETLSRGSTRGSHRRSRRRGSSTSEQQPSSWYSWCSII
ncbi:uncharacterized protein [Diadema setosum]|uniref:uncharacterized protein n=1 Tax=Diadema setosum TaxID=31175 RepID=UPI003B3A4914